MMQLEYEAEIRLLNFESVIGVEMNNFVSADYSSD